MTTPTKLFLCSENVIQVATLSTTVAAVASQPVSNLKLPSRGRTWKQASTAAVSIKGTFGGAGKYINFMDFRFHNLSNAATHRLQLHQNADWTGATIYDSVTVDAYDGDTLGELDWGVEPLGSSIFNSYGGQRFSTLYFTEIVASCASFTYTITDTGNSDGFLQGSRLFMGKGTEMAYNPKRTNFRWVSNAAQFRKGGGTLRSSGTLKWREITTEMGWINSTQRSVIADMARNAGLENDLFLSCYPGVGGELERDFCIVGKFIGQPPDLSDVFYDTWSSTFKFGET